MIQRVPMTKNGYDKLRTELTRLESVERIDVIRAIETARGHGDLKENAEYHAAKERQGHIEGKIMELKDKLGRAEVIDFSGLDYKTAVFGTVVTMLDLDTEEEMTYQLLGPEECDVNSGSISVFSPLGKAILGKTTGDEVSVSTPRGMRQLEIMKIAPPSS